MLTIGSKRRNFMERKRVENTSKGLFQKLFGKDRVEAVELEEKGFRIFMQKTGEHWLPLEETEAIKVQFYFAKTTPFRILTFVSKEKKEYSLDVDPYSGEVKDILSLYAKYQLKGELSDKIEDYNFDLQTDRIRLEEGELIEKIRGEEIRYPWSHLEYYRIDIPSQLIHLKFQEKKLFVSLAAVHLTNLWLVLEVLKRFAKKQ